MAAEWHCVTRYLNVSFLFLKGSSTTSWYSNCHFQFNLFGLDKYTHSRQATTIVFLFNQVRIVFLAYRHVLKCGASESERERRCAFHSNGIFANTHSLIATAMKYLCCCLVLIINWIRIETKDSLFGTQSVFEWLKTCSLSHVYTYNQQALPCFTSFCLH